MRKRFGNGVIVGVRRGEWWVGVRRSFATDAYEVGFLGLTLILPQELFERRRR